MKAWISGIVVAAGALALSACTDAYEERGLCSYFDACEMGMAGHIDVNYCKELGSCDGGTDPTEYTTSGKPTKAEPNPTHDASEGN